MRHLFTTLAERAKNQFNALEDSDQSLIFLSRDDVDAFLQAHGESNTTPLDHFAKRTYRIRLADKGRLSVIVEKRKGEIDEPNDPRTVRPWFERKKQWAWTTDAVIQDDGSQIPELDKRLRHVCIGDRSGYWMIRRASGICLRNRKGVCKGECQCHWGQVPFTLTYYYLRRHGYSDIEIAIAQGLAVDNPWLEICEPFQPRELPGRKLNISEIQLRFEPVPGPHPTWDSILAHCGADFDSALRQDAWAQRVGIISGYQYLLIWIACLIRDPFCKLPYLFFYGGESCGKTSFLKAVSRILTCGVVAGDRALRSEFNAELQNALLVAVEERDLNNKQSHARLKDLVTNDELWIRRMRTDLYKVRNLCHFVHTANDKDSAPVSWADTRASVAYVSPLAPGEEIPPAILNQRLDLEGPAFLSSLLSAELPPDEHRLRLRAINNTTKQDMAESRLPPFIVALVEYVQQHGELTAVAAQLSEYLGPGDWPTTLRYVRQDVESCASYLRDRRVTVEYPPRNKYGLPFSAKLGA